MGKPQLTAALLVMGTAALFLSAELSAQNWPRFRGENGAGVSDRQNLPVKWDLETGENIIWKHRVPGTGHSSPIVWGDLVFVTTAVGADAVQLRLGKSGGIDLAQDGILEWKILCLQKSTGKVLWQTTPYRGDPRAKRHVKASQANATPVTDGRYVAAIFGSQGLSAFDLAGNELWSQDLGKLNPGLWKDSTSEWGHASSPVIYDDLVVVQVDRHAGSYLAAFYLSDGEPVWRTERDELPVWSTPLVVTLGERTELIVNGGNYVRSYNPATGKEYWRFADFAEVKTPSPFLAEGKLVVTGGYPGGRPIFAFKRGLEGDVSLGEESTINEALYWNTGRYSGYTPTAVLYRQVLYSVNDNGVVALIDAESGELIRQARLPGNYSASPVASDGKIYFCSEDGEAIVRAAPSFEELGRMELESPCMATPAISDGMLFLRTQTMLYAIGNRG